MEILYALIRSGLWSRPEALPEAGDWEKTRLVAEAQTVGGVVADGIGQNLAMLKATLPKMSMKLLSALVMGTEQVNLRMNAFLRSLFPRLEQAGIPVVVVKGQGVAQYYPEPLHRQAGDIDLVVSREDFPRAEQWLTAASDKAFDKEESRLHEAFSFGDVTVELHGSLDTGISGQVDRFLAGFQQEMLSSGHDLLWNEIPVPDGYHQTLYVFVHLLQHFFQSGVGLRQLCDWAVLLHRHAGRMDTGRLERDLRAMGLLREWQVLGAFVVDRLGLPREEMPLYVPARKGKMERISQYVMRVGNMGKNIDRSYYGKDRFWIRKAKSLWLMVRDFLEQVWILPEGAWTALGCRLRTSLRTAFIEKK